MSFFGFFDRLRGRSTPVEPERVKLDPKSLSDEQLESIMSLDLSQMSREQASCIGEGFKRRRARNILAGRLILIRKVAVPYSELLSRLDGQAKAELERSIPEHAIGRSMGIAPDNSFLAGEFVQEVQCLNPGHLAFSSIARCVCESVNMPPPKRIEFYELWDAQKPYKAAVFFWGGTEEINALLFTAQFRTHSIWSEEYEMPS